MTVHNQSIHIWHPINRKMSTVGFLFLLLGFIFSTLYCDGLQSTFVLERISNISMEHKDVLARDHARHEQSPMSRIINLPLEGPKGSGFYFTKVKIGNPPKEFHLTIDTGSVLTWVSCIPCDGCPSSSTVVPLNVYDPHSSHSAERLSCSGRLCRTLPSAKHTNCASSSSCDYSTGYGDGTQASGHYVLDSFLFDTFVGSASGSTPANVVFGCTNHQIGDLTHPYSAFDGLLGLGQHPMSILSQLEFQGVMPKVFSHCLNAEGKGGGGTLVLGEIVEPGIIYTPLVPKQEHYNVDLLSISINGQTLPIDPEVFSISRNRLGTIFDSGTTYSYLTEEAYDPFLSALSAAVPPSVISYTLDGNLCFMTSNRDVLPLISLNFAGGASMVLKPETYLLYYRDVGRELWCVGFRKNQFQNIQRFTILGDLFLQDKVIVYDLAQQRLGWSDYDCLSSLHVSLVPPRVSSSSSRLVLYHRLIPTAAVGFFVYISMFAGFLYL